MSSFHFPKSCGSSVLKLVRYYAWLFSLMCICFQRAVPRIWAKQLWLFSRSITTQPKMISEITKSRNKENVSGQSASYRDQLKLTFGCKHYKRNCKLVSACCNKLYTCRLCHDDDVADHTMDRYSGRHFFLLFLTFEFVISQFTYFHWNRNFLLYNSVVYHV